MGRREPWSTCEVCHRRPARIQCHYCGKSVCEKCYCPNPKSWDWEKYPRLCCGIEPESARGREIDAPELAKLRSPFLTKKD
jgi:hypothetical protein